MSYCWRCEPQPAQQYVQSQPARKTCRQQVQYSTVIEDRVPTLALASKPQAHEGGQRLGLGFGFRTYDLTKIMGAASSPVLGSVRALPKGMMSSCTWLINLFLNRGCSCVRVKLAQNLHGRMKHAFVVVVAGEGCS